MSDSNLHHDVARLDDPLDMPASEFFRRARERLSFDVPAALTDSSIPVVTGDPGRDAMLRIIAVEKPLRAAAVLIAIVDRDVPTVLLTTRAATLNDHAGQISFPGGKIEAADTSPADAALREAFEEIGLKRDFVEPLGYLDVYATGFGFRIMPVVARVTPGYELVISPDEVDDAFEVPLAFLMDPVNHNLGSLEFRGMKRSYYEMPFEQRRIWGATAGMLRRLYERIYLS